MHNHRPDLNEMLVFARVASAGSFTAAARMLGMPKSTVSRKISALEDRVGARLIQRTTRKLRLTEPGHVYYDRCARIVADAEEANAAVTQLQGAPRGLLRVTVPLLSGILGETVAEFLQRYPDRNVAPNMTSRAETSLQRTTPATYEPMLPPSTTAPAQSLLGSTTPTSTS
jgi:DNA-binding transcriptional LysR family regulator